MCVCVCVCACVCVYLCWRASVRASRQRKKISRHAPPCFGGKHKTLQVKRTDRHADGDNRQLKDRKATHRLVLVIPAQQPVAYGHGRDQTEDRHAHTHKNTRKHTHTHTHTHRRINTPLCSGCTCPAARRLRNRRPGRGRGRREVRSCAAGCCWGCRPPVWVGG
jgi:hypothetical protein